MSTCLSGGRAYGFAIEIIKSPSTSSRISQSSSSPSSTISESSNSPVAISTRKPRTPRKRPNQTYNEAATLLSTACPNVFSTKHIKKISKFTPQHTSYYFHELPELVLPFRVIENSGFLLHPPLLEQQQQQQPNCLVVEQKVCEKPCLSPAEINSSSSSQWNSNSMEVTDDFDTESMLDEEMGEGIDSIMGNLITENEESNTISCYSTTGLMMNNTCYGFPMGLGLGFEFGFGMRNSVRALRNVDEGNWWRFPTVDIADLIPKPPAKKVAEEKKKKKKKKVEKAMSVELKSPELNSVVPIPEQRGRLLLKLNYDAVLDAWSDRGNPLPDEISGSESPGGTGNDIHGKLAQIDLFSENGGLREASVMRYKEKRRNRLFSNKIRYQVRKVNADRRPRMKGRFVRRPNSPISEEG